MQQTSADLRRPPSCSTPPGLRIVASARDSLQARAPNPRQGCQPASRSPKRGASTTASTRAPCSSDNPTADHIILCSTEARNFCGPPRPATPARPVPSRPRRQALARYNGHLRRSPTKQPMLPSIKQPPTRTPLPLAATHTLASLLSVIHPTQLLPSRSGPRPQPTADGTRRRPARLPPPKAPRPVAPQPAGRRMTTGVER